MNRAALVPLLACAVMIPASAGERHSPAERYKMFQNYLVRRAAEVTKNNLAEITDAASWKRRRPEIRKRVLEQLGLDPLPPRTPLNARVTGSFERDLYRVEKVVFESMPHLYVTGNLYVPKGLSGRAPAVVYVCGHSPGPWGAKVRYQHHGIWLARHGFVAFLIDTIEFGEVPGIHHGTHDLGMWYWHSLGYTPAGPEAWNAMRALDYLETRPEVDARRVAITGISGGGAVTWYAAAADERFQAAASVCGTWTVGQHAALDAVQENCDCIYFTNAFQYDLPAVGALIAPRPFKILSAKLDVSFPPAGYHEAYNLTRRFYDYYDAGDKLVEFDWEAPHKDIPQFRKEADEWINHWLRHDDTPFDEGTIVPERPETLTVLKQQPPDAINGDLHRRFIHTAELKPRKTRAEWEARRAQVLAGLKAKVFSGFPPEKVRFDAWKSKENGWASFYADTWWVEFTTEQGIRVNGQLFVPRSGKKSYPALIYMKGAEDVIYPVDYDPLLPVLTTHVVLVLEPRATGYPGVSNYKWSNIRMTTALIGSTIESMQTWDLLRSVDFLTEAEGLHLDGISVYGRKQMGALGLYAAAMDPRITRVILDDPPASHWQGPPLLNVLRVTDLPEAAAIMAPREIVSLSKLPAAYDYTRSIYTLYHAGARIREVGDLGKAVREP